MSQYFNQDYFKVSGAEYGSSSAAEDAKTRLARSRAGLRGDRPIEPRPAKAKVLRKRAPAANRATKADAPAEAPHRPAPVRDDAPVALVEDISTPTARTGKKRRSSKKKHQVEARRRHHDEEVMAREHGPDRHASHGQDEPAPIAREPADRGPNTLPEPARRILREATAFAGEARNAARDVRAHPRRLPSVLNRLVRKLVVAARSLATSSPPRPRT